MTIINVCNLFAPIVGPLIGIINILILLDIIHDQIIVYDTFYSKLTFYIIKDLCQM